MPGTKVTTDIDLDFSAAKAILLNCTLQPAPEMSHTEGLIRIARTIACHLETPRNNPGQSDHRGRG